MRVFSIRPISSVIAAAVIAAGCAGANGEVLTIPDTPDGTVREVLDGLAQHRPEVLWRALPPSYQSDVTALAAEFSEAMDPVVFQRAVAVGRKAVVVLQSQKDLIFASELVRNSGIDLEHARASWEHAVFLADSVLASDLARLEAYADLDVENVLATTGRSVMSHAIELGEVIDDGRVMAAQLAALDRTTVSLRNRDGDRATVRIETPDKPPKDVEMIRVEGRWVPAEFAAQWKPAVERARERIAMLRSEEAAQLRVQMLVGIGIVEGFIDQIEQMEDPDEFDELFRGVMGGFAPPPPVSPVVSEG